MVDFDAETKLGDSIYQVKPLHAVPKYIDECCNLINLEWKRSHTARLRSVESSCDKFPTNLILLRKSEKPEVIGHCKISKFSPTAAVVFVESVVIHPDYRGKGLGKLLMIKTESYVLCKGIEWIYLSTQGQELFYEKLGYLKCQPINIFGCPLNFNPDNETEKLCEVEKCEISETKNSTAPPPPPLPAKPKNTENAFGKMRDFVSSNYCDFLWINDVLSLKKNSNHDYVAEAKKSRRECEIAIKFVAVFGLIVEIKHIPNKGYLYTVDDGTGVIICNYNNEQFLEIAEAVEKESDQFLNSSLGVSNESSRSFNESTKNDDTIFNDKTYQADELLIMKKNRLMGLQSLWTNVLQSYQILVNKFNIGDTVYVQGKLYTYFDNNQIYVNSIYQMSINEEIIQTRIKLADSFEPLVPVESDEHEPESEPEVKRNPKRKFSGIITFDHIPHTEMKVPPSKFFTPKKSDGDDSFILKKRKSIISPCLDGVMTFDTNYNFNDSMEMDEL